MGEELATQGLDVQVIVTGVVGLITTITSGWVSWLFAKKKYNAEVDSTKIENMQKSLEFYIQATEDYKKQLDEAQSKVSELSQEKTQIKNKVQ